jgi:hypothetical protein
VNGPWRCAVCETVNDGGGACAACGALRSQTTSRAAAPDATPPGALPVDEAPQREVPGHEPPTRREREGSGYATSDVYDYLWLDRPVDAGDGYDEVEVVGVRPRVRWYGCCLPVVLATLAVLLGAATVLAQVVR